MSHILELIHSAGIKPSNKHTKHFGEECEISLCYPSGHFERFDLLSSKTEAKDEEYVILNDILETARLITEHHPGAKPKDVQQRLLSAWQERKAKHFCDIILALNRDIPPGPLQPSKELLHHFLNQLYARSVYPDNKLLTNHAKAKLDTVYGELKPAFLSQIFEETNLNGGRVLLDLGSGVGNAVLQAALERGAESWGIELSNDFHKIALLQRQQFQARLELWGIQCHGSAGLIRGDFVKVPAVEELIERADVILCNNLKFEEDTDLALREKLREHMKKDAVVVSTKAIHPVDRKRESRDDGVFRIRRLNYEEGSVSWCDKAGVYYIATKLV